MTGRIGLGPVPYPPVAVQLAGPRPGGELAQPPTPILPQAAQADRGLDTSVVSPLGFLLARAGELIRTGGTLALLAEGTSSPTRPAPGGNGLVEGQLGIPFGINGVPDFDGVRAAGGKVTGGIPGGYDIAGINWGNGNSETYYAAEVTPPGVFVKGMVLVAESPDLGVRRKFVENATRHFLGLPCTAAEARSPEHARRPTFETRT